MVRKSLTIVRFLMENSMFLLVGAIAALIFANMSHEGYETIAHPMHFVVNEILMCFFFGRAAKEIREAMLPGGALNNPRTAALPLLATVGGMAGPALLYVLGAYMFEPALVSGWAIPTATDIAFSYMVARYVFGQGHPAIPFLLLLAIADDGGGLLVLALFYPTGAMNLGVFSFYVGFAVIISLFMWRQLHLKSFWWYIAGPGVLSWWGFYLGGIHPALALVPIMWTMPHEHDDLGLFAEEKEHRADTLNRFADWWKNPVELILLAFGFVSAGVVLSSSGPGTWLVGLGLIVGKPLGITALTLVGLAVGLKLPETMKMRDVVTLGAVAGIGFTVALFVSGVAFSEPGPLQDSVKMGALISFFSAPLAVLIGRALRVGRWSR